MAGDNSPLGLEHSGGRPREFSETDVVRELRRLSDDGSVPRTRTVNELASFSQPTARRMFGSWEAAAKAAGLEPSQRPGANVSDDGYLRRIRTVADALGHPPRKRDFEDCDEVVGGVRHIIDRFGSWDGALEAAGLDVSEKPDERGKYGHRELALDKEELIEDIRAGAAALGRPPSSAEYTDCADHYLSTIYKHWDTWDEALEAAGLGDDPTSDECVRLYLQGGNNAE